MTTSTETPALAASPTLVGIVSSIEDRKERKAVREAIEDANVPAGIVADVLTVNGYKVSATTIKDHRRRMALGVRL